MITTEQLQNCFTYGYTAARTGQSNSVICNTGMVKLFESFGYKVDQIITTEDPDVWEGIDKFKKGFDQYHIDHLAERSY